MIRTRNVLFVSIILTLLPGVALVFPQPVRAEASQSAGEPLIVVPHVLSLSYGQAVEAGIRSNLDLMAARFDLPMAKADELTAGLWYNPEVSFDAGLQPFGRNWHQTNSGGPREFDTAISYPLDLSGKKSKSHQKARIAVRAAEASFQDAVRMKVLEIRLAYVDTMLAREALSLSQEKEVNLQRLVDVLQSRIGDKELLPLLQTRAQLALGQTKLQTRQKSVDLSNLKNDLAVFSGFSMDETTLEITTRLRDFKLAELPEESEFIQEALKNRPDMIALQLNLAQANVERKLMAYCARDL